MSRWTITRHAMANNVKTKSLPILCVISYNYNVPLDVKFVLNLVFEL